MEKSLSKHESTKASDTGTVDLQVALDRGMVASAYGW